MEVFDHGGTLLRERRATYDPATGNLTSFTAKLSNGKGPTQTATIGRRLSLDNTDAGLTEYRYDPAGNLINMRKRGGSLAGAGRGMCLE